MPIIAYDAGSIDFDSPGKRHYQVAFHLDGAWGYSLVPLTVVVGKRGANPNGIACFGGTHGNEYEGQIAVQRLAATLDPEKLAGRVILMPRLSESACRANTRISPLDGVNMNRAFPGSHRGTISYRIAHFVKTSVFPHARIVIDIHAGGNEGSFPICASFHPIPDAKQRREIATASKLFDTPFAFIYASTMASGLLTDEAEGEGKIAIGGEFGGGETTSRMGVRHAYEGTLNVLRHYGLAEGDVQPVRENAAGPPVLIRADTLDRYRPCPRDGVWEPLIEPGDAVHEGALIGRLYDFSDTETEPVEIRSPRDGYIAMLHLSARPKAGQTLFVIADEIPWAEVES